MKIPHRHAAAIIAWANGEKIESRYPGEKWGDSVAPLWLVTCEYRVKLTPKPDRTVRYSAQMNVSTQKIALTEWHNGNVYLTFDGETGLLKSTGII